MITRLPAEAWGITLLADVETGRRNRRAIDGAVLLAAAVVTGLTAAVASSAKAEDADVAQAAVTVLGWAEALWRVSLVGLLGFALVVVVDVSVRRRWDLARDLLVAVLLVAATGAGARAGRRVRLAPDRGHMLFALGLPRAPARGRDRRSSSSPGRSSCGRCRMLAAGSFRWRRSARSCSAPRCRPRRSGRWRSASAPERSCGWSSGPRQACRRPREVRDALAALGVEVQRPDASRSGSGSVRRSTSATTSTAGRCKVRVLGRDAQDTQRLARRWRSLAYRDPPRSVAGRAARAGRARGAGDAAWPRRPASACPRSSPPRSAPTATRSSSPEQPDVEPLELATAEQVSDETLADLWRQVARLHAAGISHGRLNASNVLVVDDGPMLVDLSAATLGAPQSALDIDVAELLVACTVLVGPERALRKAVEAGWGDAVARALPYLQRAALTPHLRDLARSHEVGAQGPATPPRPTRPARRRRRSRRCAASARKDLLLTAALVFAAYLLISQLADIGFGTIADELGKADPAWVVVALILAQSTFIGVGISVRGAVATPLAAAALRRPAVGDQVHQPDRAELGGPHRR